MKIKPLPKHPPFAITIMNLMCILPIHSYTFISIYPCVCVYTPMNNT